MIVRILGEGQYSVPDSEKAVLEALDGDLVAAVESHDEPAFAKALGELTAVVRRAGTSLPADDLVPSDLVIPFADATLDETQALLAGTEGGGGDE